MDRRVGSAGVKPLARRATAHIGRGFAAAPNFQSFPRGLMRLDDFANKYRLKVRRAEDGETIIPAKLGHLYPHDSDRGIFGLVLKVPADDSSLDNTLRARKRKAEREGFEVHQEGDFEAVLLFDASDSKKARLAIRLVGAKRKRTLTAEQRAAKVAILERARIARMAVVQVS